MVAVEMEVAGELLAARTTFFSCWPLSSQRSTCRTKKVASIWLRMLVSVEQCCPERQGVDILGRHLPTGLDIGDDQSNARRGCYRSSILEKRVMSQKSPEAMSARKKSSQRTLSPKPHMRARMGC